MNVTQIHSAYVKKESNFVRTVCACVFVCVRVKSVCELCVVVVQFKATEQTEWIKNYVEITSTRKYGRIHRFKCVFLKIQSTNCNRPNWGDEINFAAWPHIANLYVNKYNNIAEEKKQQQYQQQIERTQSNWID